MLPIGARLPRLAARPVSGPPVDTDAVSAHTTVAIAFLRHAGSPCTRRDLTALDAAYDELERARVVLIGVIEGDVRDAYDVVPRQRIRFPVVYDPDAWFYKAFAVREDKGLLRTIADPRSVPRWFSALTSEGRGGAGGPLGRLPAACVARNGVITWSWDARTAVQPLPVGDLAEATARR